MRNYHSNYSKTGEYSVHMGQLYYAKGVVLIYPDRCLLITGVKYMSSIRDTFIYHETTQNI
jgi:hypothetical protein